MKYIIIFSILQILFIDTALCQQTKPEVIWEKIFGSDSTDGAYTHTLPHTHDGNMLIAYKKTIGSKVDPLNWTVQNLDPIYISLINQEGVIKWTKEIAPENTFLSISSQYIFNDSVFYLSGYQYKNGISHYSVPLYSVTSGGRIEYLYSLEGSKNEFGGKIAHVDEGDITLVLNSLSDNGDFSVNYGDYDTWVFHIDPELGVLNLTNIGYAESDTWYLGTIHTDSNSTIVPVVRDLVDDNSCLFDCPNEMILKEVSNNGDLIRSTIIEDSYVNFNNHGGGITQLGDYMYLIYGIKIDEKAKSKIVKLDKNLNIVDSRLVGGSGDDVPYGMFVADNLLILYGISNSIDGDINNTSNCNRNWIMALNQDLEVVWSMLIGEPCKTRISGLIPQVDGVGFVGFGAWLKSDNFDEDKSDIWMFKLDYPIRQDNDACDFVNIYPNQITESTITIEKGGRFGVREPYQVINALGQVIQEGTLANSSKESIQLPEGLPAGMYWLRITCEAGSSTQSFMKLRK
jgi:hypothetical protein